MGRPKTAALRRQGHEVGIASRAYGWRRRRAATGSAGRVVMSRFIAGAAHAGVIAGCPDAPVAQTAADGLGCYFRNNRRGVEIVGCHLAVEGLDLAKDVLARFADAFPAGRARADRQQARKVRVGSPTVEASGGFRGRGGVSALFGSD